MFLTNETADRCPIMQQAMAAYASRFQQEKEDRQAIREGRIAAPDPTTWGTWNISDRD